MIRQTICLATLTLACAAYSADTPPAPTAAPTAADLKKIDGWVKALGSDDFKEREDATKALRNAGEAAKPALEAELAATRDAEVRSRLAKLLDHLKPFLTLSMLNDTERSIVKMELPELEEDAESAPYTAHGTDGYHLLDIGNIRVAIKGAGQPGARSSSTVTINSPGRGGMSRSSSSVNGRKTSTAFANGVSTLTTPEITFTITGGVMEIDGQKVKFEKTAKVIFIDEKGKFEKLYDFAKDVQADATKSAEPK
jgi:hypothetical protein